MEIDTRDGSKKSLPKAVKVDGEELEIDLSSFFQYVGNWNPAIARDIMARFKNLMFNWSESRAAGTYVYVAKTTITAHDDPTISFAQSQMQKLGIEYPSANIGQEFVHSHSMIQLSDLGKSPVGNLIAQKDDRNTLSAEEIGILAHTLALVFRTAALGHGPGDEVGQQYTKQKQAMAAGGAPKKFPGPAAFWLAWFQLPAKELTGDTAEMVLAATVTNDVLFTTVMQNPAALATLITEFREEFTRMGRSLSKRGILDMERKAGLILTSEAYTADEEAALRGMKTGGLQSLHLGSTFEPPCPPGVQESPVRRGSRT